MVLSLQNHPIQVSGNFYPSFVPILLLVRILVFVFVSINDGSGEAQSIEMESENDSTRLLKPTDLNKKG